MLRIGRPLRPVRTGDGWKGIPAAGSRGAAPPLMLFVASFTWSGLPGPTRPPPRPARRADRLELAALVHVGLEPAGLTIMRQLCSSSLTAEHGQTRTVCFWHREPVNRPSQVSARLSSPTGKNGRTMQEERSLAGLCRGHSRAYG
jgi:hypothetical protein